MKTIEIYKAQAKFGKNVMEQIEDLRIVFDQEIPQFPGGLSAAAKEYEQQGKQLANALYRTLPGGVYDQVLCAMMKKRASLLRVRHE